MRARAHIHMYTYTPDARTRTRARTHTHTHLKSLCTNNRAWHTSSHTLCVKVKSKRILRHIALAKHNRPHQIKSLISISQKQHTLDHPPPPTPTPTHTHARTHARTHAHTHTHHTHARTHARAKQIRLECEGLLVVTDNACHVPGWMSVWFSKKMNAWDVLFSWRILSTYHSCQQAESKISVLGDVCRQTKSCWVGR